MRRVFTTIFCIFMLLPISTSLAAVCGDVTGLTPGAPDGQVNILDIIYLIDYKFKGGPEPDCQPEMGTVTDIDGNTYHTIKIGNQWWMAENLKVTHYRNGDAIPNVTDGGTWAGLITGAYCEYNNDANNVTTYGRLYNWHAVSDNRNIAPAGWHVPTDAEWKQLEMYLGMSQVETDDYGWRGTDEGEKLKESGTTHWFSPNTDATNESDFTALPAGYRNYDGSFIGLGNFAYFSSSTEADILSAWGRYLSYAESRIYRYSNYKLHGVSVRCVKD